MSEKAEAGKAGGKRAGYAIGNCQVEGCYPSFAKPDEKNGKQDRNYDECYCDCHVRLILQASIHGLNFP